MGYFTVWTLRSGNKVIVAPSYRERVDSQERAFMVRGLQCPISSAIGDLLRDIDAGDYYVMVNVNNKERWTTASEGDEC